MKFDRISLFFEKIKKSLGIDLLSNTDHCDQNPCKIMIAEMFITWIMACWFPNGFSKPYPLQPKEILGKVMKPW